MCEKVQKPLLDCDWLSRTSRRCVEHLFFTYLNLVRIPKWNAGKRWYSGPSTSGRGGHGNGRGQVLRVVRNGQGREISPYWYRSCSLFQLVALGSLLNGRREDQADILRQVVKGSEAVMNYVPDEKRSGYGGALGKVFKGSDLKGRGVQNYGE